MGDNAKAQKAPDVREAGERVSNSRPTSTMKKELTVVIKLGMADICKGLARKS